MNRPYRPGYIDPSRILWPLVFALGGFVVVRAGWNVLAWLGALHGL